MATTSLLRTSRACRTTETRLLARRIKHGVTQGFSGGLSLPHLGKSGLSEVSEEVINVLWNLDL